MALTEREMYYVLAAVGLLVLIFVYNRVRPAQGPTQEDQPTVSPMLSRFAVHDGSVVGETVAIDGGQLILKQSGEFKAVAADRARLEGDEVRISGAVDWDEARAAGAAWLERNRKGHDTEVTQELTRSEDVRSPAREAFERRQREIGEEE